MDQFWEYFSVLAPSIGVFVIFWFLYKAITRADALERETEAEVRAEYGLDDRLSEQRGDAPATDESAEDDVAEQPSGNEDTQK